MTAPTTGPRAFLVLHGPARLVRDGRPVRIRTKGLALLYVLALEGPARREWVADLLWGHTDAANNLRVELHRLRTKLASIGVDAFPRGQDPLELPESIALERTSDPRRGDVLLGLDDLSEGYQSWLERHRSELDVEPRSTRSPLRLDLIEQVARRIHLPYLLIMRGPPGAGRRHFVQALAKRLNLPLHEGATGRGRAVHFIGADVPEPKRIAQHILDQSDGLWALVQSTFSPESELLLRLRNDFPAERVRYLEFDPLAWHEAQAHLLTDAPFDEAARIYIETGGHQGYMSELLRLRPGGGFDGDLPLPQRIRAAYLLEAHHLPKAARTVLDRLSVHPGPLSDNLLGHLGFARHLDTLEASGWLRFGGHWTFTDETARRVIYRTVHRGRQRHYHARFAAAFAEVEPDAGSAVAYHRAQAGHQAAHDAGPTSAHARLDALSSRRASVDLALRPPLTRAGPGREHALLLDTHRRLRSGDGGASWYWVRQPQETEASFAEFSLPDGPCLLRVDARLYTESVFDVGPGGAAHPLCLWFGGRPGSERRVVFADVPEAEELADGTLLLPVVATHGVGFACDHRILRVESRAEAGVVEFRLQAHALERPREGATGAYDLRAPVPSDRIEA